MAPVAVQVGSGGDQLAAVVMAGVGVAWVCLAAPSPRSRLNRVTMIRWVGLRWLLRYSRRQVLPIGRGGRCRLRRRLCVAGCGWQLVAAEGAAGRRVAPPGQCEGGRGWRRSGSGGGTCAAWMGWARIQAWCSSLRGSGPGRRMRVTVGDGGAAGQPQCPPNASKGCGLFGCGTARQVTAMAGVCSRGPRGLREVVAAEARQHRETGWVALNLTEGRAARVVLATPCQPPVRIAHWCPRLWGWPM